MDRGDDITEPTASPRTRPSAAAAETRLDLGRVVPRDAPLPMPPGAFDARSGSEQVSDTSAPSNDSSNSSPDFVDPLVAALAQIDAEASRRSAEAHAAVQATAPRVEPFESWQNHPPKMSAAQIEQAPATSAAERTGVRSYIRPFLRYAGIAVVCWLALVVALIGVYRFVNPPMSALMLQKWLTGNAIVQQWTAIENMSPNIVRAVLLSEDGRFCEHNGVDYEALQQAMERAGSGAQRGASTISMQVVKNLFLWPSKSYIRKAIELPLTYIMEFVWSKRRIMEVYLNIAEWGPGIFGIERAAEYHFNKTAKTLSAQEAARLAVSLPNPIARDAGDPGWGTQRLAGAVQVRMRLAPMSQLACVLPKRRF